MANKNPVQNEAFKAWQRRGGSDRTLSTPIYVRFPVDVLEALNTMCDRQEFIRQAVEEKLKAMEDL